MTVDLTERLDWSDATKARKGLLIVSTSTLLFANLHFVSSTFRLFSVEIAFEQARLIALGRIGSGLLLVIFVLRVYPSIFRALGKRNLQQISRMRETALNSWEAEWHGGGQPDFSPDGERRELEEKYDRLARRRSRAFSVYETTAEALALLVVDHIIPISFGFLASSNPFLLVSLVDHMTS